MYSLSAISVRWGLNDEGITFTTKAGSFYAPVAWRTFSFSPLSTCIKSPYIKNAYHIYQSADIEFPSLPSAEYRWLWRALRSACDTNSSFLNNWERIDLLFNLHTLRDSRSPQEKRLMSGDEVGWFYTCIILFWKPNKEVWLDRIYEVRITFTGQN